MFRKKRYQGCTLKTIMCLSLKCALEAMAIPHKTDACEELGKVVTFPPPPPKAESSAGDERKRRSRRRRRA